MKIEIKIPSVGESVTEVTVSNILKPSGSFVKEDEEIIELETDKVNQLLSAPKKGKLEWQVKVGERALIGQVIGWVDTEAEGRSTEAAAASSSASATTAPPPLPSKAPQGKEQEPTARVMAPQFLKELSQEKKSPLTAPAASLPSTPSDKEQPASIQNQDVTRKKMSRLRQTIAQRLMQAKNQTAMLTTFNEVDMSQVMAIREKEKENFLAKNGVKLGFLSFFVKAAVAALKAFPEVNSSLEGDEILLYHTYDIGVAVSTDKGLMVPVIRGCNDLSFGGIESVIDHFAKKARANAMTIEELRGGSFTITNGGTFGSLLSTPILNPPQSAILGMHKIQKRAMVVGDQIRILPMMYLALSYDHRLIDGKEAVKFLVHIKESIEDPARLLLDL